MQSAPPARATHPAPRARQALTDFTLMADAPTPGQLDPNWDASKAFMGTSNWHSVCWCCDETARTTARAGSAARTLFCEFDGSDTNNMLELDPASGAPKGQPQSALLEASREVGEPPAARRLAQLPLVAADAEARAELPEPAAQGEQMRTSAPPSSESGGHIAAARAPEPGDA